MRLSTIFLCTAALTMVGCGTADKNSAPSENTALAGLNGSAAEQANTMGGGNESAPDVQVSFRGCPLLKDVEGGCLIVRSNGETYDINSARPRPDHTKRLVIEGTGVWQQDTASICMTGKPLTNVKWTYTKSKCTDADK